MKIFIQAEIDDISRQLIMTALQEHSVSFRGESPVDNIPESFFEADIVYGNVPPAWYSEILSDLKWIQLESVGFGGYVEVIDNSKVQLTNLKGFFGEPVAETAVAGILALYRKLDELLEAQFAQNWQMLAIRPKMRLLHRANILILGAGSIGKCTQKLLQAFDCNISLFAKSTPDADIYSLDGLDKQIPRADVIIACLPHSPETEGLINQKRLDLMQDDAIFVNVGRGSVVDESALIDALKAGHIGGAVLDVTHKEPIPENHLLWQLPNTIITQHTGGGYRNELFDKTKLFLKNFDRFQNGETLLNVVNSERGY